MYKNILFFIILLAGVTVFISPIAKTANAGTIFGVVTDSITGTGVEGALVVLYGGGVCDTTDLEGKYEFYDLKPGHYRISVFHFKYNLGEIGRIVITSDTSIFLTSKLTLNSGYGNGKILWNVKDSDNKKVITSAKLEIIGPGNYNYVLNKQDKIIRDIPPGEYTINITLEKDDGRYSASIENIIIKAGDTTELNQEIKLKELFKYGRIEGLVIDSETGEPLNDVSMSLIKSKSRGFCGEDGRFVFKKVEPGKYKLLFSKLYYEGKEIDEIVVVGDTAVFLSLELTKIPMGGIKGYVSDIRAGFPLMGVGVSYQGAFNVTRTDSTGYFELMNLPVDIYNLSFILEEYESFKYDHILVTNGEMKDISLSLTPRSTAGLGEITVCVTDSLTDEPLSDVIIHLKGTRIAGDTDESGEFTIKYLEPGTYKLYVCRYFFRPEEIEDIIVAEDSFTLLNIKLQQWKPGDGICNGSLLFFHSK